MPTALELRREGWKPYLKAARHQPVLSEWTPGEQRERERLLDRIREASAVMKTRFGARRVVLFGSLAHAAWFSADSDIDLGVEGLAGDAYWQAWRMVEEIIGDRRVDLIEIETAGESLKRTMDRYGIEL
ncbi:MAG: DNA polymerase [Candidatus Latescibacteria bacterium]|nr:DNA polymerase [Candidatus Latescibacterota bacterium]